jgi:formylglycine-generating enzyme required for sulfatase activity
MRFLDRVIRGGSWSNYAENCRSTCRLDALPDARNLRIGFRVIYLPQPK